MKFNFFYCFSFLVFFFSSENLFARWSTSSRVHQIDGPVEASDQKQKILKIVLNSINPPASSTISGFSFTLSGNTEIASCKIVYTSAAGDSNFVNATNTFGIVTSPGASVTISGTYTAPATGLFFFWLIMDANSTITGNAVIDAVFTSINTGANPQPTFENGALPISPTGFRFTSRNYKIGTGEQYPTMLETANGISRFDYDGTDDIFMELTANYANPIENAQIAFTNHTGPAKITIRPEAGQTGKITSGDPGSGLYFIGFGAGVQKIILDGRPGGTGTVREWTIRNTRSTSIMAGAIAFMNASSVNTLSFLNIEAANTVEGIVTFSTSTGATGNNNNTLSNCLIKPTVAGFGATIVGVYSSGTAGKNNSGNTIDNCEFSNILANAAGSSHISIAANSDNWTITNNSFYNTTNFSGVTNSYSIISIAVGSGYNVSGNFIGGKEKNCGGAALSISSSSDLKAIHFGSSVTGTNTINGNTIANISYTASSSTLDYMVKGIFLQGGANYNIGSSGNGNTLGSMTSTGSITITNTVSGGFGFAGIRNSSTGTVNITYNNIGGITVGASGGISNNQSMMISRTAGTVTIDNNIIGGTVANSITQSSNAALFGINNSNPGGMTVTNNTLQNFIHSGGTGTDCNGIVNGDGTLTATGNTIKNFTLYSNVNNYSIYHGPATSASATISSNIIQDITSTNTGTSASYFGILIQTGSPVTCNNNTIGSIADNNISIAGNAPSYGIFKTGAGSLTCNDNTIQEMAGTSTLSSARIIGIYNVSGTISAIGNTIKNLDCASSNLSYPVVGIHSNSTASGNSITKNTIQNINLTNTSALNIPSAAIYTQAGSGTVSKNFISGITNQSTGANSTVYGCISNASWNFYNNVIIIENSTSLSFVDGIDVSGTGNINMHHNTVKLYGTATGGTGGACTYITTTGTKNIKNNIFQNLRTGPGTYYTVQLGNTTGLTINNNFLEVANNQNQLCYYTSDNTFAQWKTNTGANKELNGNVTLDAIGKVTTDPFPGAGTGTNLTAPVVDDKIDITRGVASWMGAFEGANITTSAISPLAYCAGGAIGVSYTVGGGESFNGGNIFTAQLSNSAGDFSSPTNIGTLASTNSGTIAATIPGATPTGTGYRIRVVSSDPVVTGSDNGANINIATAIPSAPTVVTTSGISCSGFTATWSAPETNAVYYIDVSTASNFATFVSGYNNLNIGDLGGIAGGSNANYNVTGLNAGTTYYWRVKAENGCGFSAYSGNGSATTSGTQRVLVVSSIANGTTTDGVSLRWAITEANNNCGHDSIHFGFGAGADFTISLTAALPVITGAEGVTIDGFNNSWCTLTGTVATNGTTSVTGTGTSFLSEIAPGALININGEKRIVATVPTNLSLTVTFGFSLTAASQKAFKECTTPNNGTPNSIPVFNITAATPLNPVYKIILGNGGTVATGLVINSGSNNNVIRGLVLQDFGDGTPSVNDIAITVNGNNNKILGCYIGMDAGGTTRGTKTAIGIQITGANNSIGNGTAAGANLISGINGNLYGVFITGGGATGNSIKGNMIGLQKDGSTLVTGANQRFSIRLDAANNTVGGINVGDGNVVSGSNSSGGDNYGIYLTSSASGDTVQGNIIGPRADGVTYVTANTQKYGVLIDGGNNNVIGGNTAGARNIISANEFFGIVLYGSTTTGNSMKGNYIGTDKTGTAIITGSTQDKGIMIWTDPYNNIIGGTGAGDGNVISGNNDGASTGMGVIISSPTTGGNTIVGNIIGTQKDGLTYLASNAQAYGVYIGNSSNNIIGGNTSGARNIISANELCGVYLSGAATLANTVKGNYIGIAIDGTSFITNSSQNYGVYTDNTAASNTIGGSSVGEGNVISGNNDGSAAGVGIYLASTAVAGNTVIGNTIGPQADGLTYLASNPQGIGISITNSPNNTIGGSTAGERNIISANGDAGVYIANTGSTGNIVKGNYIGIDKNGTGFITGSTQDYGVYFELSAASNTIGGSGTGEGNVVSGNKQSGTEGWGIYTSSNSGNTIIGNIIGPQADGLTYVASNAQFNGIAIMGSPNNIIGGNTADARNIISANEAKGIHITGAGSTGNTIKGNYIGIDATGTNFISSSTQEFGLLIANSAGGNIIGGTGTGEGNVISGGAGSGVYLWSTAATGNSVVGNIIGPQADGLSNLAGNIQSYGVFLDGSRNNTIGGNTAGARNIISANETYGVYIIGAASTGNTVKGNYIGAAASLTNIAGSSQDYGVYLEASAASNNIGTGAANEENQIAFNTVNGVYLTGTSTTGNLISKNPIYNNTGKPVVLNYGASQANNGKAFPVISSATPTTVSGTSGATDVVEVFKNTTGNCFDAATYVGSATAAAGAWSLMSLSLTAGEYVLATARDGSNNTSEFSSCSQVIADLYWVGGNGAWNNPANWSYSSGGTTCNCIPDIYSNVFIDNNSGTNTISMPAGTWYTKNFTMSGAGAKSSIIGQGSLLPRP